MHRALRHRPIEECFEHYRVNLYDIIRWDRLPDLNQPCVVHRSDLIPALGNGSVPWNEHGNWLRAARPDSGFGPQMRAVPQQQPQRRPQQKARPARPARRPHQPAQGEELTAKIQRARSSQRRARSSDRSAKRRRCAGAADRQDGLSQHLFS